jgi:D-beta-D-heptose 7-phosphate kinase/D-beta-D-heptose 1-phosphate adenosyltransferase
MTGRAAAEKIVEREAAVARYGRPRSGTLVFTNGCFDLLHRGHVFLLTEARALGDALVVGLNTDDSVRRLAKGSGRPIVGQKDRAVMVAALEAVDAVCLFDEDTPVALIEALEPDGLVKGADYALDGLPGRDEVVAGGGRVELIAYLEGYSTSGLVRRIREIEA